MASDLRGLGLEIWVLAVMLDSVEAALALADLVSALVVLGDRVLELAALDDPALELVVLAWELEASGT